MSLNPMLAHHLLSVPETVDADTGTRNDRSKECWTKCKRTGGSKELRGNKKGTTRAHSGGWGGEGVYTERTTFITYLLPRTMSIRGITHPNVQKKMYEDVARQVTISLELKGIWNQHVRSRLGSYEKVSRVRDAHVTGTET